MLPPIRVKKRLFNNYSEQSLGYPTPCWIWKGGKIKSGYGLMFAGKRYKTQLTHRLSLMFNEGNPPKDKPYACHKCHNVACINPSHLYWGSASQNTSDTIKRLGVWKPGAKTDVKTVLKIRDFYDLGIGVNALSLMFKMGYQKLWLIVKRHRWRTLK